MFYHMSLEHEVLVHPCYFGKDLREVIEKKLYSEVEGCVQGYVGYIICITAITNINYGVIPACETGMATFPVKYNALVFRPFKNEVFDGIVKQVNKVGVFVDIGPLTCFISHNSMPSTMEFSPNSRPPCYKSKDEDSDILAEDSSVRLKIVGLRNDIQGMFAIGSLMDDFLGPI